MDGGGRGYPGARQDKHLLTRDVLPELQRDPTDAVPKELEIYHQAKQIKLPSQVPASAGGLNKTSKTASSPHSATIQHVLSNRARTSPL